MSSEEGKYDDDELSGLPALEPIPEYDHQYEDIAVVLVALEHASVTGAEPSETGQSGAEPSVAEAAQSPERNTWRDGMREWSRQLHADPVRHDAWLLEVLHADQLTAEQANEDEDEME